MHPCFSAPARHKYARMHLPVAPLCNISCNYCNRKFDCANESRPGVSSQILTPEAAGIKYRLVKEKLENLSVAGIAGPGDALANWESTRATINIIRKIDPRVMICLSTNGLMLPQYGSELLKMGVGHVTVTVNCLDPEIGKKIYRFVNFDGKSYVGSLGAGVLIENQLAGIELLARGGVLVKVNIVMIKGVNDLHIPEVVRKVRDMGAYISNIMPLIPAPGSTFAGYPATPQDELDKMRKACQADLLQMFHCRQCRADAVGLLGNDRFSEFNAAEERKARRRLDSVL